MCWFWLYIMDRARYITSMAKLLLPSVSLKRINSSWQLYSTRQLTDILLFHTTKNPTMTDSISDISATNNSYGMHSLQATLQCAMLDIVWWSQPGFSYLTPTHIKTISLHLLCNGAWIHSLVTVIENWILCYQLLKPCFECRARNCIIVNFPQHIHTFVYVNARSGSCVTAAKSMRATTCFIWQPAILEQKLRQICNLTTTTQKTSGLFTEPI